jgi:hypothetical protein
MRKSLSILLTLLITTIISGCIVSKTPNTNDVTIPVGAQVTFSVVVFPPTTTFAWTLDGTPLSNTGSSYVYTAQGGEHFLTVKATHILGTDTQTWHINSQVITFQRMYGGSGWDIAFSTQQTSDGGYIVAGASGSNDITGTNYHGGSTDYYILKLDANGEVVWQQLYGGSGWDGALSIQQTDGGGYIVAGGSDSTDIPGTNYHGGSADYYILKLDANGAVVWQQMYGGSGEDEAISIHQTSDGGYIVAGMSSSTDIPGCTNHGNGDYYLLKLDADGAVVWQRMYDGSDGDIAYSIQQTSDNGYIVAGMSFSTDIPGINNHGGLDYYLIKLDSDGLVVWQRMEGGAGVDMAFSIQQTSDGRYIVAGQSNSTDIPGVFNYGGWDYYVLKLDADGAVVWQRMYGGSGNEGLGQLPGNPIIYPTNDGGYIVAGVSGSTDIPGVFNHGGWDYYLLKLDADGAVVWQQMYGGSSSDEAYSIQQTSDGGYIVAGYSGSTDIPGVTNHGGFDYYLLKLDADGNL